MARQVIEFLRPKSKAASAPRMLTGRRVSPSTCRADISSNAGADRFVRVQFKRPLRFFFVRIVGTVVACLIPCLLHSDALLHTSSAVAAPRGKATPTRTTKQRAPASDDKTDGVVDSTIQLPERPKTDPVAVATVSDGEVAITVENPVGNPLKFRTSADTPQQTWTVTDGTRKIARISRTGSRLELSWAAGAPEDAECLRNAILRITDGRDAKAVALRAPGVIDAPLIDLSKPKAVIPTDVPLWGLAHKVLKIEAAGLVDNSPPVEAFYPSDRRAVFGKKVRVVVRDEPPHAGIQLSLVAAGDSVSIKVEPLIVDFDDDVHDWTLTRIKMLDGALVRAIKRQETAIPRAKSNVLALQSQLVALRLQYNPSSPNAILVARAIETANADLLGANGKLEKLETALPINKERLGELAPLRTLATEVHQKARVTFRVFHVVAGQEVDVLRAQPIVSPGERGAGL